MATAQPVQRSGPAWFSLPAPFVFGWREVFIPLAVVVHDQHGPALVMAGLAVAAARVGGWFITRTSGRRRVRTSALLAGGVLLLLGLTPEEGPAGLLLWLVFGIAWSLVEIALANLHSQRRVAEFLLLAGMALAGPLAAGPGSWLIAAVCFVIAWRAGPDLEAAPGNEDIDPGGEAGTLARWLPFLFSVSYLAWFWLVPACLLQGQVALVWIGALAATHWLARLLAAAIAQRRLPGDRLSLWYAGAALALAVTLAALAVAQNTPATLLAGLIASGAALGVVSAFGTLVQPGGSRQPGESQALGEVLGPAAGALLVLLLGQQAVFVVAALSAAVMALVLMRGSR